MQSDHGYIIDSNGEQINIDNVCIRSVFDHRCFQFELYTTDMDFDLEAIGDFIITFMQKFKSHYQLELYLKTLKRLIEEEFQMDVELGCITLELTSLFNHILVEMVIN